MHELDENSFSYEAYIYMMKDISDDFTVCFKNHLKINLIEKDAFFIPDEYTETEMFQFKLPSEGRFVGGCVLLTLMLPVSWSVFPFLPREPEESRDSL